MIIIAYVSVPKDFNTVKTKVAFNLTKRQIICFALAGATGIPIYLLCRNYFLLATDLSAIFMVVVALPFFLFALYEKNSQTLEQVLKNVLKVKFLTPSKRPYKTKNFYRYIHEYDLEKGE